MPVECSKMGNITDNQIRFKIAQEQTIFLSTWHYRLNGNDGAYIGNFYDYFMARSGLVDTSGNLQMYGEKPFLSMEDLLIVYTCTPVNSASGQSPTGGYSLNKAYTVSKKSGIYTNGMTLYLIKDANGKHLATSKKFSTSKDKKTIIEILDPAEQTSYATLTEEGAASIVWNIELFPLSFGILDSRLYALIAAFKR